MKKSKEEILTQTKVYIGIFLFVLCSSVLGIIIGESIAKIQENHPEYLAVGWVKGIVIFFVAQLISMYLHEIIHVIAYKLQGIDIRILYLFPVCIVKEESHIKFYLAFNLEIGLGGIVIPELPIINNDTEYNSFRNRMSLSLLCAPLFSALLGVIFLILVCSTIEYVNYIYCSYFFVFCSAMVFWSVYINAMSFLNIGSVIGDYSGAKKMKTDEVYSLLQIYNYFLLQENDIKREMRYKNDYLINHILLDVKELPLGKNDRTMNFLLVDSLLYELIMGQREINLNILEPEKINVVIENLQERLQFEAYSCFFLHSIIYLCICNKIGEAKRLWERYNERIGKNKRATYRFKQVELFLYGKNRNDFYVNNSIAISSMDSLLSKVHNYYDDELYINNIVIACSE